MDATERAERAMPVLQEALREFLEVRRRQTGRTHIWEHWHLYPDANALARRTGLTPYAVSALMGTLILKDDLEFGKGHKMTDTENVRHVSSGKPFVQILIDVEGTYRMNLANVACLQIWPQDGNKTYAVRAMLSDAGDWPVTIARGLGIGEANALADRIVEAWQAGCKYINARALLDTV